MDDYQKLSEELSAVARPLLVKAHALGYEITSFNLEKRAVATANIAPRDFSSCTTHCGPDPITGQMVCKVHCP